MKRCFGEGSEIYSQYHDTEWGFPSYNEKYLLEMLILEGAQAGLSWETILKRREGYRTLFLEFDLKKLCTLTDAALERILQSPKIIRNRRKVFSVRQNARVFAEIQKEYGKFSTYLWGFVGKSPLIGNYKTLSQVPVESRESQAISKDLKKRGMSFVGPKIIYAYMQAVGLVNDHLIDCPRFKACQKIVIKNI